MITDQQATVSMTTDQRELYQWLLYQWLQYQRLLVKYYGIKDYWSKRVVSMATVSKTTVVLPVLLINDDWSVADHLMYLLITCVLWSIVQSIAIDRDSAMYNVALYDSRTVWHHIQLLFLAPDKNLGLVLINGVETLNLRVAF